MKNLKLFVLIFIMSSLTVFSQDVKIQELSPNVIIIQHKADGVPEVNADTLDFYDINQKIAVKRFVIDHINAWTIDKGTVYVYWRPKNSFKSNLSIISPDRKITTVPINLISTSSEFYNKQLITSGIDSAYSMVNFLYKIGLDGKIVEKERVEIKNNTPYSMDPVNFSISYESNDTLSANGKMKYSDNYLYFPGRKLPHPMFSIIHASTNDKYYAFNNRVGDEANSFNTYFYDKKGDLISVRKERTFKTFLLSKIYMVASDKIYVLVTPEDYPWIINLSSFKPLDIISLK